MQLSKYKQDRIRRNAKILVDVCGQVRPGERALIVADGSCRRVGAILARAAAKSTTSVSFLTMAGGAMHGAEPPAIVRRAMAKADVIFGISKSSMAHTEARLAATKNGARYLSLADYSIEQLSRPSLGVDFFRWARVAMNLKKVFDAGKKITVTTKKGTDLTIRIAGREANFCPGFCAKPGTLGSPPDIETNIPPLETESDGVVVVDGSIPCKAIGLLKKDIRIRVRAGRIVDIDGGTAQGRALKRMFEDKPEKARVLAEFGVGLNPKARLCGLMLEDEGCLGTIHLGFGSNATIGGRNRVNFHLDFVIRDPTVFVDERVLMRSGALVRSYLS